MILSRSYSRRRLPRLACLLAALGVAVFAVYGCAGSSPSAAGGRDGIRTSHGFASLPPGARGPVGAALGRAEHTYWLRGVRAVNPVQRLGAGFTRDGVEVDSGLGRLRLSLAAWGRSGALRSAGAARPRVQANRVTYRRGVLREWYANGPLGLEQGFDLARAPVGGRGPLTFSLARSGNLSARMQSGVVVLSGYRVRLRYGGLVAADARGRALRAWLQLSRGRLLVRVDDRGARYPVHIDPFIEQAELTVGDGGAEDRLGASVAVSGDTVVVGAPYHAVGGHLDQGAVYVFVRPAAGWASTSAPSAELTVGDGAPDDVLGSSVGVSGDTIVAGADQRAVDNKPGQGAAYVFVRPAGGWASTSVPTAVLTADNGAALDEFGHAVAISGDTIVVGAPQHKPGTVLNQVRRGAAYVFLKPAGGWATTSRPAAELSASEGVAGDKLGSAVGVSGDTVVAGDPARQIGANPDQGAVYVFVRPVAGWSGFVADPAELTASDGAASDKLGLSVGVSGDTVVGGAPQHKVGNNGLQGAAYVFVKPASGWSADTLSSELTASDGAAGDQLGYSVAVSGNTVIAGAPVRKVGNNNNQGVVYAFVMPAGGWATTRTPDGELTAPAGAADDGFGYSVAVSGDTVAAGTPGHTVGLNKAQGAAHVFTRPAPWITIESPHDGARYRQGEVVDAVFACADPPDGSGLASCSGTTADGAPIDTGTLGAHTFTVSASDTAGEQSTQSVTYTVVSGPGQHATAAPTMSRFTQSHRTWREGTRFASISRKRRIPIGTIFSFTLDQRARVVFAFTERTAGRKVGRRCVAQTSTNRRRRACQRAVAAGELTFAAHTGINKVVFQGRVSPTRRLKPGSHTVTITAINAAGRSRPRQLTFTIGT